eukprot:TRINITY_DN20744_c0_g5_i1.p1 TRINITY_DN20744_c0_g5~~TRINITY_DN20744_c0_g5_i1.p1  ORF type:complete len:757 (+),score=221.98 TRINITY_DN20744_c0_g5_i1:101-2371(+)
MGCGNSTAASADENLKFLSNVKLFQRLPQSELPALEKAATAVNFSPGTQVIRQGDEGHEFFIIKQGTAEVVQNGKQVAKLGAGDFFGENALIRDEARTASIVAVTSVKALKITRSDFVRLGLNDKLEFPKRAAIGGANQKVVEIKPPSSKKPEEIEAMIAALKGNTNLQNTVNIDDVSCKQIIELMWKETVAANHPIIQEGDLNADYFYIVDSGSFNVMKTIEGQDGNKTIKTIGTVSKGGSFGELALLYFAPRAATVKANEPSAVWVVSRDQFKKILATKDEDNSRSYVKYLDTVDLLNVLKDSEKQDLAKALQEASFSKGETIFEQGAVGDKFYILISGEVSVVKDGRETAKLSATGDSAQIFGEMALLNNAKRGATINVISQKAMCLTVDKVSFDMLLGPLEALKARGKTGTAAVAKVEASGGDQNAKRFGNIKRKELKRIGLLGCGGFGAVELVEHVPTKAVYALKSLSKGYIIKSGMQQGVMSEKNVQALCDSPFIVKLVETYNGDQSLYFLLEVALGGELYATYNRKNLFGNVACAKFYVAGTTYAFEHLHNKKVIFRDLKPENLLLTEEGRVKLTDMGLAKVSIGKTYTTCGTPDYFAPELIASKGHTHSLDWWTLGILLFELLAGSPPFESPNPMQIYTKVAKGIDKVAFPRQVRGSVESLIKGLLTQVPSERLPMKSGGIGNIKRHEWYSGFDWEKMLDLTLAVPYKPVVKNKLDIGNFNARKEEMPPMMQYVDPKTGWDNGFATST